MFFGSRRQREESIEEPNYWISFSDFAFSFLISFILLTTLIIIDQQNKNAEANSTILKIKENYAVRNYIAIELDKTFKNNPNIDVNPETGNITILNQAILFKQKDSILLSNPEFIKDFFEKYINALKNAKSPDGQINYYDKYIDRIIIEGHVHGDSTTDPRDWMKLSQDRARTVYNILYPQIQKDTDDLIAKVHTAGRSNLIEYKNAKVPDDNRRVEFHFTLNEELIAQELADDIQTELVSTGSNK